MPLGLELPSMFRLTIVHFLSLEVEFIFSRSSRWNASFSVGYRPRVTLPFSKYLLFCGESQVSAYHLCCDLACRRA